MMDEKIKETETQEEGYLRIEQQNVKFGNLVYKVQMHLNVEKKARKRNLQGLICCTKNYQPDKYQERQSFSDDNETCYIKWKIETADETKIEKVIPELEMAVNYMEAPFRIEFVHIGSLILGTTVKSGILQNNKVLRRAVKTFLKEIQFFGEINTNYKVVLKVDAFQLDKEKFYLKNADDSPGSPSDECEKDPFFVEVSECSSNEPLPISNNAGRCESNLVENSDNSLNAPLPVSNNVVRCYSRNIHELNLDRAPEYSSNTPQPVSHNAVRCYSRNIHELNLDRAPEYSSNAPQPVSNNAVRCYSRNIHELNLDRAPENSSNAPRRVSNNAVRCVSRNIHELNLEYSECPEQLVYVYN
ncbi:uncharacterized protein [Mytilus edulis]|uniref:uncharacterized protein n=1 Tax=Mytilus edulis TaxID=6550 RepID=UPI0039EFFDD6